MESQKRKSTLLLGGKKLSLPDETLFLLDECLDRNVAEALKLVGYNFTTVSIAFEGRRSVTDPEIIEWLHQRQAVWVHADDRAKKEHRKLLAARNVRTLWVYRPGGSMSGAEQLRILAFALPDLLDKYQENPSHKHYRVDAHGQAPRPRIRLQRYELQ